MRNLEDIEQELAAARETLSQVKGTPAEVYSRIVGYYRSVRNWNKGKREEFGERKLYRLSASQRPGVAEEKPREKALSTASSGADTRVLLFVQPACPACPGAKAAAGNLGIPVDLVNAGTEAGLAEAAKRRVYSTPTAILLSAKGEELGRARDSGGIAAFGKMAVSL